MSLTSAQLASLRAKCFADPAASLFFQPPGNSKGLENYLNADSSPSFFVWRKSVQTLEIGLVVNYIAVAAMTTANLDRVNIFYVMNPDKFDPSRSDIRQYLADTFSGALGGQGAATIAALEAMYRTIASNAEKMLSTGPGNGTNATPAVMTWEGLISPTEATQLIYKDDGTIWTP